MKATSEMSIEFQYKMYLELVKLDERTMHPIQAKETKQAFYAACGQMLILLRDTISELSEEEGVVVLERLVNECADHFNKLKDAKKI